jgi:hypothetical protein
MILRPCAWLIIPFSKFCCDLVKKWKNHSTPRISQMLWNKLKFCILLVVLSDLSPSISSSWKMSQFWSSEHFPGKNHLHLFRSFLVIQLSFRAFLLTHTHIHTHTHTHTHTPFPQDGWDEISWGAMVSQEIQCQHPYFPQQPIQNQP